MSNRQIITAHALVRYLERVRSLDLAPYRAAMPAVGLDPDDDGALLHFLEVYTPLDLASARRDLLSAPVRQALGCGAQAAVVGGFRYVIINGQIVTVMPRPDKPARIDRRDARRSRGAWRREVWS